VPPSIAWLARAAGGNDNPWNSAWLRHFDLSLCDVYYALRVNPDAQHEKLAMRASRFHLDRANLRIGAGDLWRDGGLFNCHVTRVVNARPM
jgi:hypothetical protein